MRAEPVRFQSIQGATFVRGRSYQFTATSSISQCTFPLFEDVLLRILAHAYRMTCQTASATLRYCHLDTNARLTLKERQIFVSVCAPLPEVAVHLHRNQDEILVNVQVDRLRVIQLWVDVYRMASELDQSAITEG